MAEINIPPQEFNPKEPIEINVIRDEITKDYASFIESLAEELGVSNREAFYKRIEGLTQINNKAAVDLDKFRENFLSLIHEYAAEKIKHHAVVPTETQSSKNIIVHGDDGQEKIFRIDREKEENEVSIEASVARKEGRSVSVSEILQEKEETNIDILEELQRKEETNVDVSEPTTRKEETNVGVSEPTTRKEETNVDVSENLQEKEERQIDPLALQSATRTLQEAQRSKSTHTLELMVYNILPYSLVDAMAVIRSLPNMLKGATIEGAMRSGFSAGVQVLRLMGRKKYYSPEEIGRLLVASSFLTLHFNRGRTIKDLALGPGIEFSFGNVREVNVPQRDRRGDLEFNRYLHIINSTYSLKVIFEKVVDVRTGSFLYVTRNENGDIVWKETTSTEKKDTEIKTTTDKIKFKDRKNNLTTIQEALKDRTGVNQIGSLYVWPIDNDIGNPFFIPFEFTPRITTNSRAARYQATQVLARMGDLQSYVGTDSLNISLSTFYYPFMEKDEDIQKFASQHIKIDEWMSMFSLQTIQLIELAYNSLVLPFFGEPTNRSATEEGYRYSRPPLVKVIIGDAEKLESEGNFSTNNNAPFSNLLTYPSQLVESTHILSSDWNTEPNRRYFRTFIVTGVEIRKDMENSPLYLNRQATPSYLMDVFGFEASLNMIEVTPNYMDVLPGFGEYYSGFSHKKGVFKEYNKRQDSGIAQGSLTFRRG